MQRSTHTPVPAAGAPTGSIPAAVRSLAPLWPLWIGIAALTVPTLIGIARSSWTTDQGGYGPFILAIGAWLVTRRWREVIASARPGSALIGALVLAPVLALYVFARITTIIVVESACLYVALLTTLYLFVGGRALRPIGFPLAYLLFALPLPTVIFGPLTEPLRLEIARQAIALLSTLGYPIANNGLTIFIDQYELLVEAACSGYNSMISLVAIGLFYAYLRHDANWRYFVLLLIPIVALAVIANFIRVIAIVLITHYWGDAVGQGFLHGFAGIFMFTVALAGVMGVDALGGPLRRMLARPGDGPR